MTATERRASAAYWYAVGRSDESGTHDYSYEFSQFARAQAEDYYSERVWVLSSVPDQWQEFLASLASV